jgi:2'-5' RNA ligase
MRCFIALDLNPPPGAALSGWMDELRAFPELSVPPPGNIHLTLAFLGELDDAAVGRALTAMVAAAPRAGGRWAMRWGAVGAFPSLRRPRVLWLGVADEAHATAAARGLNDELAAAGLAVDQRPFRPHLTVARVRKAMSRDVQRKVLAVLQTVPAPAPSTVTQFVLYRSALGPGHSVYQRLGEARL